MIGVENGDRSLIRLVDVYETVHASEFLYRLLAERKVSESISHKRHPSFEEHDRYVHSKPYLGWYLIYDGDEKLGTCYITKYREVGIWLMPDAKGRGAGKEAMRQLLAMHPGRVFTNTSIHNDGAKAFYEKLGFRHCANMLEHENTYPSLPAFGTWRYEGSYAQRMAIEDARSSDSSGKVEQQPVAAQGTWTHWGSPGAGLDVESGQSSSTG